MHSFYSHKSPAVFLLFSIFCFLFSSPAYASDATLYLSPPAGTYTVNDHAMIRVFVSSDGAPVYGVEGVLAFDPLKMQVVSVSHEASALTSWPTPPSFDNEKGEIYFGGVLSTSTVLERGHVFSIVITPLRAEDFRLSFTSGAAILAGDGTGGNIVSTLKSGDYTGIPRGEYVASEALYSSVLSEYGASSTPLVTTGEEGDETRVDTENITDNGEVLGTSTKKEIISSSSHPDQNAWYALGTSTISWEMPADVTRVRLALNKKPEGEGLVPYNAPTSEKVLTRLPEGIQYVHLTREWSDGHTDGATYRIQTDITAPSGLIFTEKPREDAADPRVVFFASATDTLSGIDRFEFVIDSGTPLTWIPDETGEYRTPALSPGAHEILARAVDKAGNVASSLLSFSIEYLPAPTISLSEKKITEGKHLEGTISGIPGGVATLSMKRGEEATQEEIPLNNEGNASFASALTLLPGTYEVWATVRDARGAVSGESEHFSLEAAPSLMGIIKRHPLIPIVTILFVAFLFAMRFFWNKLYASDDSEDGDTANEAHQAPHQRQIKESTVVLSAVKRKQGITIS